MSNQEFADKIRNNLFADRGTDVYQAFSDAYKLIEQVAPRDRIAAMTALHVVVNTIANKLTEGESK
jgi:hypothetical protein